MAQTDSNMLALGTKASPFTLRNAQTDRLVSLETHKGEKGTIIMFLSNTCPFVKHVNAEIIRLCNDYRVIGFGFIAINSNDSDTYPEESETKMRETAQLLGYPFPYVKDEDQQLAKAYKAACTPDFFVFDEELHLVYRGQLDNSRPGNGILVNGRDLREALDNILNNNTQRKDQKPSMGCGIKWKKQ